MTLLETIFRTVTGAISSHPQNRKFFKEQIGHATLTSVLKLTGILPTKHAFKILECLLDLATENISFHQHENPEKVTKKQRRDKIWLTHLIIILSYPPLGLYS